MMFASLTKKLIIGVDQIHANQRSFSMQMSDQHKCEIVIIFMQIRRDSYYLQK
jgi:hypothetical protein